MQRLKLGSTVRNLLVDGTIFAGFLLATDPHATGQTIHEWLGIAFGAGIITHLLLHWKWIVNVVRRFFSKLPGQVRINSLLNSLLFVAVTLIIFSGIMISKVVLSTFGLSGSHDMIWRVAAHLRDRARHWSSWGCTWPCTGSGSCRRSSAMPGSR